MLSFLIILIMQVAVTEGLIEYKYPIKPNSQFSGHNVAIFDHSGSTFA